MRRTRVLEAALGVRAGDHPVLVADRHQDRRRHLLPGNSGLEAQVARSRARGHGEVEEAVGPLVEVAPGQRLQRDLRVVGDPVDRDPSRRARRPSAAVSGPFQRSDGSGGTSGWAMQWQTAASTSGSRVSRYQLMIRRGSRRSTRPARRSAPVRTRSRAPPRRGPSPASRRRAALPRGRARGGRRAPR